MVRPDVSAISPRIPASCLICLSDPRAPESDIILMLLKLSSPSNSLSVSSLSATFQVSITALYLSSSVILPRRYSFEIFSMVSSASDIICFLTSGTVISEIDTVNAACVEYLNPCALTASRSSAVWVAPWILIHFSRIGFNCFLPTRKLISSSNRFSGLLLSTNPKS